MDKKTKLMAACAAGAVAILVGAGIARCAIAPGQTEADAPVAEQQQTLEEHAGLSGYAGTTWESEDGTATLTISDSAMVEQDGSGAQVMYYEVVSEEAGESGVSAVLSYARSAQDASTQTLLVIEEGNGTVTASCDGFALSKRYLLEADGAPELALSAHSPELNELLDADDAEIASAIARKAATASPSATLATWDGEVYMDCNADVLTTSFHLDDAASTVVQLSLDQATGELSAL